MLPHDVDDLDNVHGLRQVAVQADAEKALALPLHRLCGEREDRDRCCPLIRSQPAQDFHATDVGKADVQEHEFRGMLACERYGPRPCRGLEGREPLRLEHVAKELHVLLVVLDHEHTPASHRYDLAGSVNTNVLPSPSSLSTQIRPPCSSTSFFESASPRPVPSRSSSPGSACWNSSKIRAWSAAASPGPVSATETQTSPSTRAVLTSTAPPAGVNFTAFERRLKITCLMRRSSPSTTSRPGSAASATRTPSLVARSRTMTTPLSSASGSEK